MVVEDPARDELQGVALVADDDRVPGVVATLVAHDVAVLLGEQIDDLGLALVTPLGPDDDGDGHGRTLGGTLGRLRGYRAAVPLTSMDAVMKVRRWADLDDADRARCTAAGWTPSSTPSCGHRSRR